MRIKGWRKTGKKTWRAETSEGKKFVLKIERTHGSSVFPYTVILQKGHLSERHHEDSAKNADRRALKIQKDISKRYFK